MMTPKENFLELLKPNGQPDRQLCQYEALHMCLNDPINTYLRGNRKRGTVSRDRWGTTISFPADAPGPMPVTTDGLAVCPDITHWRAGHRRLHGGLGGLPRRGTGGLRGGEAAGGLYGYRYLRAVPLPDGL